MIDSLPKLLIATVTTLKLLSLSLIFGLIIGLIFALMRLSKKKFINNQNALLVMDNMRGEFLYDEIYDYDVISENKSTFIKTLLPLISYQNHQKISWAQKGH